MGRRSTLRSKGALRSRHVVRKAAVRKKRMLRSKVRHHNHRRYAGVRGVKLRDKKLRRTKVRPAAASAKRKTYKVAKDRPGQGLPPMSMSTYLSMY